MPDCAQETVRRSRWGGRTQGQCVAASVLVSWPKTFSLLLSLVLVSEGAELRGVCKGHSSGPGVHHVLDTGLSPVSPLDPMPSCPLSEGAAGVTPRYRMASLS